LQHRPEFEHRLERGTDNFPTYFREMAAVVFRCPISGFQTQGWIAEEIDPDADSNEFVGVECIACGSMHLVNPRTGELLGSKDEG
jgi:hypothetical protein